MAGVSLQIINNRVRGQLNDFAATVGTTSFNAALANCAIELKNNAGVSSYIRFRVNSFEFAATAPSAPIDGLVIIDEVNGSAVSTLQDLYEKLDLAFSEPCNVFVVTP